jgi:hypothetical protein
VDREATLSDKKDEAKGRNETAAARPPPGRNETEPEEDESAAAGKQHPYFQPPNFFINSFLKTRNSLSLFFSALSLWGFECASIARALALSSSFVYLSLSRVFDKHRERERMQKNLKLLDKEQVHEILTLNSCV